MSLIKQHSARRHQHRRPDRDKKYRLQYLRLCASPNTRHNDTGYINPAAFFNGRCKEHFVLATGSEYA
ncbi:hypothetical protein ENTCAN_06217 [Enterobacter cancerogenus ATCC 35316]|nr:hypothetical protein ENTCAN_06217 [Enterobacter cancerogenus ATCC 35316]